MQIKISAMKKFLPLLLSGVIAILLTACGTHNNGYGDTDGIYTSNTPTTATTETEPTNAKANYYKQYFKSKENDYENLPEENLIFTDIESYSTNESMDEDGNIIIEEPEYDEGYGGWGSNTTEVTVNVYNSGGWGYYNNWYRPWGRYGSYWGWGYPYYYSPYWGISWGWAYPYWYGGYYGHGHHYYPYSGHNYYNNVAYNRGRRSTGYYNGRSAYSSGRSNVSARRGTYSRSELNRRSTTRRSSSVSTNRRRNTSVNSNTNVSRRKANTRVNSTRNTNTRRNTSVQRRKSTSQPRVNNTRRSSRGSGSFRSSGSSRRSSGSFRSSGSSRSSGSRSSGSRRGGRG